MFSFSQSPITTDGLNELICVCSYTFRKKCDCCVFAVTCALCGQASEMAAFVQAKRDLGCKAPQVTVLEEGINTESRWAKEFWTLLGGKTKYRGTCTHFHK